MSDQVNELISRCKNRDKAAEYELYDKFAPQMFGICLRFGGNEVEAKEILQDGFLKVFGQLRQFSNKGAFEGWVHRIFIRTAIDYYHQKVKFFSEVELHDDLDDICVSEDALSKLSVKDLLSLVQRLPAGYRTIFNLHVIDNYEHQEIAEMLGIAEGTSKSKLYRAKACIRRMLKEMEK